MLTVCSRRTTFRAIELCGYGARISLVFLVAIAGCSNTMAEPTGKLSGSGHLIFDGNNYEVGRAEIRGHLADPYWCDTYNKGRGKQLGWSIRFEAVEREIDGERLSPSIDFDGLPPLKVSNWPDLTEMSVTWSTPTKGKTNDRYGLTYLFDHQLIVQGSLKIVSRDGIRFRVVASGKNEEGQTFSIDAPAEFVGIYVEGTEKDNDRAIRDRLSKQIAVEHLIPGKLEFDHEIKYENGAAFGQVHFKPKKPD